MPYHLTPEYMSKLYLVPEFINRNRPSKTQFAIFISAAAVSSIFIAASSLYGVEAVGPQKVSASLLQANISIADSPAAKSTLAPLEDSVEVIAKVGNVNLAVASEKTQEILDKVKGADHQQDQLVDIKEDVAIAKAIPLPAALQEMPDTTTEPLAEVLIAAPAIALQPAAIISSHGSAYPYATVPFPNMTVDPWGMYMRQCVSYTAWKVASSGRTMPYWGGRGNAAQWDDNARAAGIPVDGVPRVGSVAVDHSKGGGFGHTSYVEEIYSDGTIRISQYNARWDGTYSEERVSPAGLVFIHF